MKNLFSNWDNHNAAFDVARRFAEEAIRVRNEAAEALCRQGCIACGSHNLFVVIYVRINGVDGPAEPMCEMCYRMRVILAAKLAELQGRAMPEPEEPSRDAETLRSLGIAP
jgi:hypothetical protein